MCFDPHITQNIEFPPKLRPLLFQLFRVALHK